MKKFILKSTLLLGLLLAFSISYGQKTTADCPKKGTVDCPVVNCPLKGTPDCPLVNCPKVGTPDCPYTASFTSQSSNTAKATPVAKKAIEASYVGTQSVAKKKELPSCCRKSTN